MLEFCIQHRMRLNSRRRPTSSKVTKSVSNERTRCRRMTSCHDYDFLSDCRWLAVSGTTASRTCRVRSRDLITWHAAAAAIS